MKTTKAITLMIFGLLIASTPLVAKVIKGPGLQAQNDLLRRYAQPAYAATVTHFSWGKVVVTFAGKKYTFKDCKLSPQGPQAWDWNEFKTRHVPGIQIQDLQSIINDSDIIILSRGVDLELQTKPETLAYLKEQNKEVHVLQSEAAVTLYNDLVAQGKKVGMLLHSTC